MLSPGASRTTSPAFTWRVTPSRLATTVESAYPSWSVALYNWMTNFPPPRLMMTHKNDDILPRKNAAGLETFHIKTILRAAPHSRFFRSVAESNNTLESFGISFVHLQCIFQLFHLDCVGDQGFYLNQPTIDHLESQAIFERRGTVGSDHSTLFVMDLIRIELDHTVPLGKPPKKFTHPILATHSRLIR